MLIISDPLRDPTFYIIESGFQGSALKHETPELSFDRDRCLSASAIVGVITISFFTICHKIKNVYVTLAIYCWAIDKRLVENGRDQFLDSKIYLDSN